MGSHNFVLEIMKTIECAIMDLYSGPPISMLFLNEVETANGMNLHHTGRNGFFSPGRLPGKPLIKIPLPPGQETHNHML